MQVAYADLKASAGSSIDHQQGSDRQAVVEHRELFKFDPNHLPSEQWVALGLSERQAETIHHYEDKGGRFRTKHDVAKMRVVDPDLFAQWEPFIQLPDSLPKREFAEHSWPRDFPKDDHAEREPFAKGEEKHFSRNLVEINTADTNQLIDLPGIGPSFARGIVKYRDRLGGFCSLDQLSEVWVLRDKPDAVAKLKTLLVVDTQMVHHFPINTFTPEELGPHPYAGWKVAKALAAYRQQHGPFKDVAAIKNCVLVTDSVYRKLAPYLSP